MKYILAALCLFSALAGQVSAQTESPYRTRFAVDGPIIIGGVALNGLGLYKIVTKDGMTEEQVLALDKANVNKFDRRHAGNYSTSAKQLSDFPFYGSFVSPVLLMFDSDIRGNAGQMMVLYVETMAITGTLFTLTNGLTERRRPLVYSDKVEMKEKIRKNAKNSFYAGHTAATASATYFVAKVFHDYNPDSPWRFAVWGAAAAVPAGVGYLRLEAGKHFLSDNLLGYALGAGVGILVPQLHKTSNNSGLSIMPVAAPDHSGVALQYTF